MRPINKKKPPPTKPKPRSRSDDVSEEQPLEVYCRLRPLKASHDLIALRPISDTELQISLPESVNRQVYKFTRVFSDSANQKKVFESVAQPLVQNLINGQNGLFTTFDLRILMIVIHIWSHVSWQNIHYCWYTKMSWNITTNFRRSIQFSQSKRTSESLMDRNGFDIGASVDAILIQQNEDRDTNTPFSTPMATTPYKNFQLRTPRSVSRAVKAFELIQADWRDRQREESIVKEINHDNNYSVFVSYVEIYNNYIYDLLDDQIGSNHVNNGATPLRQNNQQRFGGSKILREDCKKKIYVSGAIEIEVKSADEAFELFLRGGTRRRIGSTSMNSESSRSHSIFTIRLVQAPLDLNGVELMENKKYIHISQLSVVDLAGCERVGRTNATGHRLKEASNINNSLMALRICFDYLRDNQKSSTNSKMVPYRDSKLTHLFKNYFEGDGSVKMILCLNPGAFDFEETLQVLKFGNCNFQGRNIPQYKFRNNFNSNMNELLTSLSFGPAFPKKYLEDPEDDCTLQEWIDILKKRKLEQGNAFQAYIGGMSAIRSRIAEMDQDIMLLRQQNSQLKIDLEARESQNRDYENVLMKLQKDMEKYKSDLESLRDDNESLREELMIKESNEAAYQQKLATIQNTCTSHYNAEKARLKRWCADLLNRKQSELDNLKCFHQEKLHLVKNILSEPANDLNLMSPPKTMFDMTTIFPQRQSEQTKVMKVVESKNIETKQDENVEPATKTDQSTPRGVPVVNPRFGAGPSSAPTNKWIEHRPPGTLDTGTILQPNIKNRKSVTNLKSSDFINKNYTKYAITHNVATSDGNVETEVYKADVIPSTTGGAQVVFHDVETLKQCSPVALSTRKRAAMFEANIAAEQQSIAPSTPTTVSTDKSDGPINK
ncbi:Kinesin-like protein kif23 [Blomia tropicalis]|nr:Kinesin-like protein kif23 [Blomia tropicalis]